MKQLVNTRLLKSAIVEAGFTQKLLSETLKMSENSLSSKINGKSQFDIVEAMKICEILKIEDNEKKVSIFFN